MFVYKIETLHYLTMNDITETGDWETFEISNTEDFAMFDHEKSEPLRGRGYFVNQEARNQMTDIINKQIQLKKAQSKQPSDNIVIPVHILSSDAAAGSLRVALDRPKKVIGFQGFFSIGPLWKLEDAEGQALRNQWFYENINLEQDDHVYQNQFKNTLLEISDIPDEAPIYIWTADNADEQIGMRFILYVLREKPNDIFIINATNTVENFTDNQQANFHSNHIHPDQFRILIEQSKQASSLSQFDRNRLINEWETLSQSKNVLRIWLNNKIENVPEQHHDHIIINALEKLHVEKEGREFIKVGALIGSLLEHTDYFIDAFYLEFRIRALVYNGTFELKGIPKSMWHYSVRLRL